jgi:Tfp pilus assembly protein PilN
MQRDINFFSVYRSPVESEHGVDKITLVGLSLIGACLIGLAGTYTYYKLSDHSSRAQQQSISDYLQSSEVSKAENTWESYTGKMGILKSYEDKAAAEVAAFQTLPVIDADLLTAMSGAMPGDVKVVSISYIDDVLTLTCTAQNKLSPANFVHALKGTLRFSSVTYIGVTYVNDTEYDFTVNCMVRGGVDK